MKILPPLLLAAVCLIPLRAQTSSPPTPAEKPMMDIGVRSGIDLDENAKRKKDPAYALDVSRHQNIYFLAAVTPHPSIGALVREVDAIAMAKELDRQLQAHGFVPVKPDQDPQIVITAEYGRGWLPNPYADDSTGADHNNLTNRDPVMPPWHLKEIFFSIGDEMKRQRADEEMLIIQVKAWKYPIDPKTKKPLLLWMTSIHVDDPDHRDLNEIYQKMLAAGAPHFDKPIDHDHPLVIDSRIPEGQVKVGTPTVVGAPSVPPPPSPPKK